MDIMKELAETGHYQRELPKLRAEQVLQARAEGHTWRAIAETLGMTQHAIIQADKVYRAGK